MSADVIVAGAGIFGVTGALELAARGHSVLLLDPGPVPHPDAASMDISKVLRMDYGADRFYMDWMEEAFAGWDSWNDRWGETLYHETGVLMLTRSAMEAGGYEFESYRLLLEKGYRPERMSPGLLRERFPAWNADLYPDGYYNPRGGWAASGRVVERLADGFLRAGGEIRQGVRVAGLIEENGRMKGVRTQQGEKITGALVVLAAGAWTPALLPNLKPVMWPTAQDVFHFLASPVEKFQPPAFPVFTADVSRTGWYGFPAKNDGTLKVAHHGPGRRLDPSGKRVVRPESEERFRGFFAETFPDLKLAPKIFERVCFYADTFDGDFWIARDPVRDGLLVASGGSGHAFKFAPVLGPLIADLAEERDHPAAARFAWRGPGERKTEDARYEGE